MHVASAMNSMPAPKVWYNAFSFDLNLGPIKNLCGKTITLVNSSMLKVKTTYLSIAIMPKVSILAELINI